MNSAYIASIINATLRSTTPILLAALGSAICDRVGVFNVALEAQAMGVPCFLSDSITKATDCGLCRFLSLQNGSKAWAQEILDYRQQHGTEKRYVA